jgi:ADP-heptose:LPS heptosyltransferase
VRLGADRIAIVRVCPGVGEMLCVVPALRAVRGTAPRAQITLIAQESSAWLPDRFPTYVDELLPFPGFPGLPGPKLDAQRTVAFLADAHERAFDLVLQLHDSSAAANAFCQLLGATRLAGTVLPHTEPPDRELYVELDPSEREPLRLLRVAEMVGARPTRDAELEFIITEDDEQELAEHLLDPGAYVCVPPDEELAATAERLDRPVLCLDGELSLGATAAALRDAALTLCRNDHIPQLACAVGGRSVVVFGPEDDVERWTPLDRDRSRVLRGPVDPEEILDAAGALLSETESAA